MATELPRLIITLFLLGIVVFLYWCVLTHADESLRMGTTNVASTMIGGIMTYWLRPVTPNSRERERSQKRK